MQTGEVQMRKTLIALIAVVGIARTTRDLPDLSCPAH